MSLVFPNEASGLLRGLSGKRRWATRCCMRTDPAPGPLLSLPVLLTRVLGRPFCGGDAAYEDEDTRADDAVPGACEEAVDATTPTASLTPVRSRSSPVDGRA